nr:MAG TPA: hypothetical protein [Caudoviricetes sp.]
MEYQYYSNYSLKHQHQFLIQQLNYLIQYLCPIML